MQQITFEQPRAATNSLKQLVKNIGRLVIACLFVEKCRFCGKEIALAVEAGQLSPERTEPASEASHEEEERAIPMGTSKRRYSAIFESYATGTTKRNLDPDDSEPIANPQPHAVHAIFAQLKKYFQFLSWLLPLSEPFVLLQNELQSLIQATTHAELALPALIYFKENPEILPRLSDCLCHECWTEIEFDKPELGFAKINHASQKSLPIASGVNYGGKVKDLIRAFKYDGDTTLSADLASLMHLGLSSLTEHMPATNLVLVPVPLHRSREITRGFNQADLLAREFSKTTTIPLAVGALHRANPTRPQQLLAREARLKNVSEAFIGNKRLLKGKTVILVDDVCTSGSTLSSCATEVLRCGALSVVALTVAKAKLAHDT